MKVLHATRFAFRSLFVLPLLALGVAAPTLRADEVGQMAHASVDRQWQRTIDKITHGEFETAADTLKELPGQTRFTSKVLTWLEEYEEAQEAREQADREDYEKYVRYAQERIERAEYMLALDWVIMALDVVDDRTELLNADWLQKLTNASLVEADKLKQDREWQEAWRIYNDLATIFEQEPRYGKLQREVQTQWRLETMFEDDNPWREQLEKVRLEDAEAALGYIGMYYVEPADFKPMCESGLEQLLLLADSKSAHEVFEGLKDDDDRRDFVTRIQARLDQVRAAPQVDRRECEAHFRRAVVNINDDTIRLPRALLVSEFMRGALEPLDDYTTIIWPSNTEEFRKHTRGDFVGVGISIVKDRMTDEIEVVTPLEDSPAFRAGVQAGDIIAAVDGEEIKGWSINKVVKTITGPANTTVTLTIRRGTDTIPFELKRKRIKIQSVKGVSRDSDHEERWNHWLDKENGIAYIRLTNFQGNTYEDLVNTLSRLEAEGLEGLVLDLRGNPGGLLDSAWRISSIFLSGDDTVVSTRGRDPSENQVFPTPGEGAYSDLPVAVLTDENSASASEIVAGAIRDNNKGLVVGERTYGKFSVQNLVPLTRPDAQLKITTARYYLPSGQMLHREPGADSWGVEPNIEVPIVRKERFNVYAMRREADLLGPAKPEADEDKEAHKPGDASLDVADAMDEESGKADKDEADSDGDDKKDDARTGENPDLPSIEQPDENDRPKRDPQLEAALLVMRVNLLSKAHPSLARADLMPMKEIGDEEKVAQP